MEEDVAVGLLLEGAVGGQNMEVNKEPEVGSKPLHDGDGGALRREGLARELINRIQNLRKAADLDVAARIDLTLACDGELGQVADDEALAELIKSETLASTLSRTAHAAPETLGAPHHTADKIDGEKLSVAFSPRDG